MSERGRDASESTEEAIGFLTGKLAEPALRRTLDRASSFLPGEAHVVRLDIEVAALMTTDWIARRLELPEEVTRLIIPGLCRGDLDVVQDACGIPVERGPDDLRDLPRHFGRERVLEDYGPHDIEIVAEINHVPQLSLDQVLSEAKRLVENGADFVDLGCDPDGPFLALADYVKALRSEGIRVSVDSLDPREIRAGVSAGAELVLSVNSQNIEVARDLDCEFIVIPDNPKTLAGLDSNVEKLRAWDKQFRIDPIVEPVAFGFARSLGRYIDIRDRYPDAEILMGIG
ncbi:MAG: DUF6513 domain-containing protein, partial [Planctomycetota bacterium]